MLVTYCLCACVIVETEESEKNKIKNLYVYNTVLNLKKILNRLKSFTVLIITMQVLHFVAHVWILFLGMALQ